MTFYTHSGLFHADELLAFTILHLAGICNSFARLTNLENIPTDGVIGDIGREWIPEENKFDHHQGTFLRENGVPFATAGMVWSHYGKKAVEAVTKLADHKKIEWIWNRVDESFLQAVDAHDASHTYKVTATSDKGIKVSALTFSKIVSMHNGEVIEDHSSQDQRFNLATKLAAFVLSGFIREGAQAIEHREKFFHLAKVIPVGDKEVIFLEENLRWKETVHELFPNARFIISESRHPGSKYSMIAVPVNPKERKVHTPIEKSNSFSGFIHEGKWIAGGELEDLYELAEFNLTKELASS